MKKQDYKITMIKVADLKPAEYNPRKHSEKQLEDLKTSMREFGVPDPLLVNCAPKRMNIIIGGHMRLVAARALGMAELPCVYLSIPDIEREKELNIRLNKNSGIFDNKLLAKFDPDFLKRIGFESEELDRIFEYEAVEDDFDAEAEYAKIKKPETQPGDVWILGKHRLLCGDSTKRADYEKLMAGKLARLINTDPPYSVDYASTPGAKNINRKGLSYNSRKYGGDGRKIFNDNKSPEEAKEFYKSVLMALKDFTTKDCPIYWWFANKMNWINRLAFEESGWLMAQIVIWLKNSLIFSLGQDYHRCYEPCMFGWKRGNSHYSNKGLCKLKDVFNLDFNDFNDVIDVWYVKRDKTSEYVHPTQKPIRLAERAIKKSSQRGDIVLDVFGGSGSTMMACQQLERVCYSMELDPKFCDVIAVRFEKMTGIKAVLSKL